MHLVFHCCLHRGHPRLHLSFVLALRLMLAFLRLRAPCLVSLMLCVAQCCMGCMFLMCESCFLRCGLRFRGFLSLLVVIREVQGFLVPVLEGTGLAFRFVGLVECFLLEVMHVMQLALHVAQLFLIMCMLCLRHPLQFLLELKPFHQTFRCMLRCRLLGCICGGFRLPDLFACSLGLRLRLVLRLPLRQALLLSLSFVLAVTLLNHLLFIATLRTLLGFHAMTIGFLLLLLRLLKVSHVLLLTSLKLGSRQSRTLLSTLIPHRSLVLRLLVVLVLSLSLGSLLLLLLCTHAELVCPCCLGCFANFPQRLMFAMTLARDFTQSRMSFGTLGTCLREHLVLGLALCSLGFQCMLSTLFVFMGFLLLPLLRGLGFSQRLIDY